MTTAIADDVESEKAALVRSLTAAGPLAPTACGDWSALDLAAHLVSEERLRGVLTFVGRSLAVRGISPAARPEAVESFVRRERRFSFETLIDRLRRPTPWLLLRPQIAPVALFEFWTHHDDLTGPNGLAHPAPVTLTEVVPFLVRYQVKQLPAGVRVTVRTSDGDHSWSVGPKSDAEVILEGTSPDLVRWLSGRRPQEQIDAAGPDAHVRAVRSFVGGV